MSNFFFPAEDGIRDWSVTGVQTCALPICCTGNCPASGSRAPRTCTRNPLARLLLVGVALVLRNVWVWLHYAALSTPRRGNCRYNLERLTLRTRSEERRRGKGGRRACGWDR